VRPEILDIRVYRVWQVEQEISARAPELGKRRMCG